MNSKNKIEKLNYKKLYIIISFLLFYMYQYLKKNIFRVEQLKIINNIKTIPKVIHCTYYNKKEIPNEVWENLKKYASDYEIKFYNDEDCKNFLSSFYGEKYVSKFDSLKLGCHKADFFRYCILYSLGGIYLDIKIEPKEDFSKIFDHQNENLFYTCIGQIEGRKPQNKFEKIYRYLRGEGERHIFQGILASYPNNPLFQDIIKDFFIIGNPDQDYHIFTYRLYDILMDKIEKKLEVGENIYNNNKIILFNEINSPQSYNDIVDRHGGYFYVENYKKEIIFRSRYVDFPWNKELENRDAGGSIFKIINFIKNLKTLKINYSQS